MAVEPGRTHQDGAAVGRAVGEGRTLAAALPRLILEARRVAATVIHGMHGRRRAGPGENFWQYRRFISGESAARVDWRRSARDDHLYVREQEWEAAHTVWIWPDRSPSMLFASPLVRDSKLYRTLVITLALAEVLVEGGERVGIPGLMRPTGSRNMVERIAQAIVHDRTERPSLPVNFAPSSLSEVVLLSDLWSEIGEIRRTITQLPATARAATSCRSSTRPKRLSHIGAASNSSSPKAAAASPPAAPKPGRPIIRRGSNVIATKSKRDRPARLELHDPPH